MGLSWLLQTDYTERALAAQLGILRQYHHRFGRMGQEAGHGYYVDAYMQMLGRSVQRGAGRRQQFPGRRSTLT